jgi:hypothetical protein
MRRLLTERRRILYYLITGAAGGAVYGCIEYLAKRNTENPEIFIPLMIRTITVGALVFGSAVIFEICSRSRFAQKPFIYLLLARSLVYTFIITISLLIVNTVWYLVRRGDSLREEMNNILRVACT